MRPTLPQLIHSRSSDFLNQWFYFSDFGPFVQLLFGGPIPSQTMQLLSIWLCVAHPSSMDSFKLKDNFRSVCMKFYGFIRTLMCTFFWWKSWLFQFNIWMNIYFVRFYVGPVFLGIYNRGTLWYIQVFVTLNVVSIFNGMIIVVSTLNCFYVFFWTTWCYCDLHFWIVFISFLTYSLVM